MLYILYQFEFLPATALGKQWAICLTCLSNWHFNQIIRGSREIGTFAETITPMGSQMPLNPCSCNWPNWPGVQGSRYKSTRNSGHCNASFTYISFTFHFVGTTSEVSYYQINELLKGCVKCMYGSSPAKPILNVQGRLML